MYVPVYYISSCSLHSLQEHPSLADQVTSVEIYYSLTSIINQVQLQIDNPKIHLSLADY